MKTAVQSIIKDKGHTIISALPTDSVLDCVLKMKQTRIGALLIMEHQKILGIFTERDLMMNIVAEKIDPATIIVSNVMNRKIMTIKPTTTIEETMKIMTDKRIRHLPVLENEIITGLISIGDITRWLSLNCAKQAHEIDNLIGYIHGHYAG
jgi:CBS domain-containing protein